MSLGELVAASPGSCAVKQMERKLASAIRVLGGLTVNGEEVRGLTRERLLCALVIHADAEVRTDTLFELCWTDDEEPPLRLSTPVSRLRDLGLTRDQLVGKSGTYKLCTDEVEIDAREFARLASEARRRFGAGDEVEALKDAEAALEWWSGEPYGALSSFDWALGAIESLQTQYLELVDLRAELLLRRTAGVSLTVELTAVVSLAPFRESTSCLLAHAHYRAGNQSEALRVLRELRERLVEELGVDPSARVTDLEGQILSQDSNLDFSPDGGAADPSETDSDAWMPTYEAQFRAFCEDVPSWFPERLGFYSVAQQVSVTPPQIRTTGQLGGGDENESASIDEDVGGSKQRLALEDALRQHQHLVIVGDPGIGKSWALRSVGLSLLDERAGERGAAQDRLPIVVAAHLLENTLQGIDLANMTRLQLGTALVEALPLRLLSRLQPDHRDQLAQHIAAGRPLALLIDGYDEIRVAAPTVARALPLIEAFCRDTLSLLALTTRPSSVPPRTNSTVAWCKLEPFSNREQWAFVGSWFEDDSPLARSLVRWLRGQSLELLRVPLMLSLFCSVAERGGEPPRSESELWERALLRLATEEGRPGEIDSASEHSRLRLVVAELIASCFVDEGIRETVDIRLLEDRLGSNSSWLALVSASPSNSAVEDLVRTGIIRKTSTGLQTEVEFLHSALRDYLVARVLAANRDWTAKLPLMWSHPEWEPVIGYLGALVDDPSELLAHLVAYFREDPLNIARLVAGRALAAAGHRDVPHEIAERVRDEVLVLLGSADVWDRLRASNLLPVMRVAGTEARLQELLHPSAPTAVIGSAISSLAGSRGDGVQEKLLSVCRSELFTHEEREAAVSALAAAGSDEALGRLKEVADDSEIPSVVRASAALTAWSEYQDDGPTLSILKSGSDPSLQRHISERIASDRAKAEGVALLVEQGDLGLLDGFSRSVLLARGGDSSRDEAMHSALLESLPLNSALERLFGVADLLYEGLASNPLLSTFLHFLVDPRTPGRFRWRVSEAIAASGAAPGLGVWVQVIDDAGVEEAAAIAEFLAREVRSGEGERLLLEAALVEAGIQPIVEHAIRSQRQSFGERSRVEPDARSADDAARLRTVTEEPAKTLAEIFGGDLSEVLKYDMMRERRGQLPRDGELRSRAVSLTHQISVAGASNWIDVVPPIAPIIEARLLAAGDDIESRVELARLRARWPGRAGEVTHSSNALDARLLDAGAEASLSEGDLPAAAMLALASVGASYIKAKTPSRSAVSVLFASGHATARASSTWTMLRGFLPSLSPESFERRMLVAWLEAGYNLAAVGRNLAALPGHIRAGNPEVAALLVASGEVEAEWINGIASWSGCRRASALLFAAQNFANSDGARNSLTDAKAVVDDRAAALISRWPSADLESPAQEGKPKWHWTLVSIASKRLMDGDPLAAVAIYEDAIAEDPSDSELRNNLGFCKMPFDVEGALADLEEAARLFGKPFGVNTANRMLANFRLGEYERVCSLAEEYYSTGGGHGSAWLWDVDHPDQLRDSVDVMRYVIDLAERAAVLNVGNGDVWKRRKESLGQNDAEGESDDDQ